ncbi:alpha/beta fold hydrolase [Paraburkholderia pallida]|uniref:Alpha/beta fold hydrolase n=1 Tax=Paraburkholderia pallida TaxID=2547399 RepID=A0A4P7CZ86_9BURK|nr:alpha/beta fold hydrolase [Paraburkholderia pallida]QBR01661.1 alpha/beta fold hydrolase [Paraburkholderia pallida]
MKKVTCDTLRTEGARGEIVWYVERRGNGPHVVLIPSGEGDCGSFDKVAENLASDFTVTTFDTPGFSRSVAGVNVDVSMVSLGHQVANLLSALAIEDAVIYGCSSAGLAALDLVSVYPKFVRRAVVHEAALPGDDRDAEIVKLAAMDDSGIAATCASLFENMMNEDPAAWRAIGEHFHQRLARNYPTWIRRYVAGPKHEPYDPGTLAGKPITWTIGGLFEVRLFFGNVQLAQRAGLDIGLLPCKHYPQVSIPGLLADHIRKASLLD